MFKLWEAAEAATGDPCVGLVVGFNVRPTTFHALGFSWLASATMLGALRRLRRFYLAPFAPLLSRDCDCSG
jgi:hypothetical protein